MKTRDERRRIDCNPANRCQMPGCGNTARVGIGYCGLHDPNEEAPPRWVTWIETQSIIEQIADCRDLGALKEIAEAIKARVRELAEQAEATLDEPGGSA